MKTEKCRKKGKAQRIREACSKKIENNEAIVIYFYCINRIPIDNFVHSLPSYPETLFTRPTVLVDLSPFDRRHVAPQE